MLPRLFLGSGCIAALEAEKFLAELEDHDHDQPTNGIEIETKKAEDGNDAAKVPEYRANPLL